MHPIIEGNKDILVSVVMPVYNSEEFVSEAIESILAQSYENYEFLIINDGSGDNSGMFINFYQDKRIRFITNENTKGLDHCLLDGMVLSNGKYVFFQSDRGISLPERIEQQVSFMEMSNQDLAGTFCRKFGENISYYSYYPTSPDFIHKCVRWFFPFEWSSLIIRKEILKKIDYKSGLIASFKEFILKIVKDKKAVNQPAFLVNKRVKKSGIKRRLKNSLLLFFTGLISPVHYYSNFGHYLFKKNYKFEPEKNWFYE